MTPEQQLFTIGKIVQLVQTANKGLAVLITNVKLKDGFVLYEIGGIRDYWYPQSFFASI